jgi:hypothetical protein
MKRRLGVAIAGGFLFAVVSAGGVMAGAGNPAGTGQPSVECEEDAPGPAGFNSGGFAKAEDHYAGEGDASVIHANSDHAESQYDVACYQFDLHH